jgi:hypothetical protein
LRLIASALCIVLFCTAKIQILLFIIKWSLIGALKQLSPSVFPCRAGEYLGDLGQYMAKDPACNVSC